MRKFTFQFRLGQKSRTHSAVHIHPALALHWILEAFPHLRAWRGDGWHACPGKHRSGPFSAF